MPYEWGYVVNVPVHSTYTYRQVTAQVHNVYDVLYMTCCMVTVSFNSALNSKVKYYILIFMMQNEIILCHIIIISYDIIQITNGKQSNCTKQSRERQCRDRGQRSRVFGL